MQRLRLFLSLTENFLSFFSVSMSQVCENGVEKGLERYKMSTISVIEGHFLYARSTVGTTRKNDGYRLAKKPPSKQADGLRRNMVKVDTLLYRFIAV